MTVLLLDDRTANENGSDLQLQSIAHGVIHLEKLPRSFGVTRRRVEVIKLRGSAFREGYHDYDILRRGLVVYPRLVASEHEAPFDGEEVSSGISLTCYEGDIRQVLSNLVGNAFDVMRSGGRLRLRTRQVTWWATGESGVMYTVADDGPGMPLAVRERVFEAFYSTKGIHGTGLGLWISKRIVHKHRGHLSVRSRAGECTGRFSICGYHRSWPTRRMRPGIWTIRWWTSL